MKQAKWIEKKFNLDVPTGWMPVVLERLYGTLPRLQDMIKGLGEEALTVKPGGKWSIKEHIGHLHDLETLHLGRIDDFIEHKDTLRAADMSNTKTEAASHNECKLQELLKNFEAGRKEFTNRLAVLDDASQETRSLHPRLGIVMKPVDMATFVAEHDDHHLAAILDIIRTSGGANPLS